MSNAVALKYNRDLPAPFVIAKGRGATAARIERIARDNDIEIVKDSALTEGLIDLDIGSYIPEHLYAVVAELLAYIYSVQAKR